MTALLRFLKRRRPYRIWMLPWRQENIGGIRCLALGIDAATRKAGRGGLA